MGGRSVDDRRGEGLIRLLAPDPEGIEAAVEALADGRLVLHPTETVVSLTGDPYRDAAVTAARRIKGYEAPRPFLCLVGGVEAALELAADWPETARRLAEAFWPGPLTLIVAASDQAPAPVVDAGRLALRPASDVVSRRLLAAWDGPLFSTSANRKGEPPSLHVTDAASALAPAPDSEEIALGLLEVAGGVADTDAAGEPSTILDVSTAPPKVVRIGAISLERIREVVPLAGGPRGAPDA